MTGQADLRQLSASDAADDLLMKPFHIHELLVRVRSMLKMKALMDEIARRP